MTNERLEEIAARVNAATPGPWFAAASSVHSAPLSREYDRVERDIPEDAPAEAYAALPNSCVATVPVVSGDTPTARGVADAAFIAHARDDVLALLDEVRPSSALPHCASAPTSRQGSHYACPARRTTMRSSYTPCSS